MFSAQVDLGTHPIVERQPKSVVRILNISEELKDMRFKLNV